MEQTELNPCPFCGGEAAFIGDTRTIKCKHCGGAFICTNPVIAVKEVADAWNRRAPLIPMYLGRCDETDCEHFIWCGDSYNDRNTECYCSLVKKGVYRKDAEEERIVCPKGKMIRDEDYDG